MPATTTFFIDIFLILTTSVLAGELANRLGQTALVGQLVVGIVLGPTLLGPFIGLSTLDPELGAIQFLGTMFILFMAGLDIVPEQISRMGVRTALMGVTVFAIPFAAISVMSRLLMPHSPPLVALFLGLTLSITALPVMGIMLREFGLLKSRLGKLLINTALVNELTAVTVFAVLLQLQNSPSNGPLAVLIASLSVGVFLSVMLAVHMFLRSLGTRSWWELFRLRAARSIRSKEGGFAILMICVIGASLFSQYLGLTFVIGAFYAGILVTRESAGPDAHRTVSGIFSAMTWGFFIPLFFAFVGIQMNLRLLENWWIFTIFGVLAAAAILTKVGTGYSFARYLKWPRSDALAIGHLASSRGAVELAMAVILLSDGVFSAQIYTIVAGVGLVTTIIAPIAAHRVWNHAPKGDSLVTDLLRTSREPAPLRVFSMTPTLSFHLLREDASSPATEEKDPPARGGSPSPRSGPAKDNPAKAQDPPPLPRPRR